MTKAYIKAVFVSLILFCISFQVQSQNSTIKKANNHLLEFIDLAKSWDEGIPLGNGYIGALIWQKEDQLRMSLDNVYLWDLRPMENLNSPEFKFSWVYEKWKSKQYKEVQDKFDVPYDRAPAPSKIPGAALEFNVKSFGNVKNARLYLDNALNIVKWDSGIVFSSFVHASKNEGWFKFNGVDKDFKPMLIPPVYNKGSNSDASPVTGQDLRRLGYSNGELIERNNQLIYVQEGWGGFKYKVQVVWMYANKTMTGKWSISTNMKNENDLFQDDDAMSKIENEISFDEALRGHSKWWANFWDKSSIQLPDQILEKQWYMEQYKFGASARSGAPPISLQAVWTADNGKLPPWKGDFHHDLNTQLSYWPAYSGNHLDLEIGFLEWLVAKKKTFKDYTKTYFESDGLAVPGVTTLTGEPMGGWIQYAFGPTVSGWLGQHFYLHWRYSMDREFLKEQAYPWIRDVAILFQDISIKDESGLRKLPISSSPEIRNNSRDAWFSQTTNFDLANIRWTYEKAAEMAQELGKKKEAKKWKKQLEEWPYFAIDDQSGLMVAPNSPYMDSHRHLSHLMAFHPYGLIDYSGGDVDKQIVDNTINQLLEVGTDYYTGYSFSWLGNLQARSFDGEGAAKTLRIFAENFCLPNSFHVNGEQFNKGYSRFKYRPFTLEGNFAFAAAIQEMLIQSHTGIIKIFPAVPESWTTVGFNQLRTEGAFLISSQKEDGVVRWVSIISEKGGKLRIDNPFVTKDISIDDSRKYKWEGNILIIETEPDETLILKPKSLP